MKFTFTVEVEMRPLVGPDPEPDSPKAHNMHAAAFAAVQGAIEDHFAEGHFHDLVDETDVTGINVDRRKNN